MKPKLSTPGALAAAAVALMAFALLALSRTALATPPDCFVTELAFEDHIYPRHCDTVSYPNKSKFISKYCNDVADAEAFCRLVQNADEVTITVQSDNRVRYDATLNQVVGKEGEKCGRLIIKSETNGSVVTQFPQFC